MLYWICPECGHECSPAIRECPTCVALEEAPPSEHTSSGILSLAQNFEPRPEPARTNGNSAAVSTAVLADEDTVELVLSPADRAAITSLVRSAEPEAPPASSTLAPLDRFRLKPSRLPASEPAGTRGRPGAGSQYRAGIGFIPNSSHRPLVETGRPRFHWRHQISGGRWTAAPSSRASGGACPIAPTVSGLRTWGAAGDSSQPTGSRRSRSGRRRAAHSGRSCCKWI